MPDGVDPMIALRTRAMYGILQRAMECGGCVTTDRRAKVIATLIPRMGDPNEYVRAAAVCVCGSLGLPRSQMPAPILNDTGWLIPAALRKAYGDAK